MAAPKDRPYRHLGVFIPFSALPDDYQWSSDEKIERDGFIYLHRFQGHIFGVQSISTGELFVNKILVPDDGDEDSPSVVPEELRFSTAPYAQASLPKSCTVRNRTRIYFNEVALWQDFGSGAYSMYLKYYNGGSLYSFLRRYINRDRDIPEHFIWHVLLTLIEAVRYLKFGALPGTDDEDPTWTAIHHRDLATRNVFIHYLPREDPEPEEGFEENAFPELILGDFGHAAAEDDDPTVVLPGRWDQEGVINEWHDTYSIFSVAKELCMKIEDSSVQHVNDTLEEDERPYSDDLITMLRHFEYPNYENEPDIRDFQPDDTGHMIPNHVHIPNMRRVVDEFLPIIRDRVQRYRNPAGGIPDGWWKKLDVSWTKPDPIMPYEWMTQGLPTALDEENQRDKGDQNKENEKPIRHHSCPKPNPESVRKQLIPIIELENDFKNERPAHQITHLDYGQPIMSEIRHAPPPPAPAMPDPPPPSAS